MFYYFFINLHEKSIFLSPQDFVIKICVLVLSIKIIVYNKAFYICVTRKFFFMKIKKQGFYTLKKLLKGTKIF